MNVWHSSLHIPSPGVGTVELIGSSVVVSIPGGVIDCVVWPLTIGTKIKGKTITQDIIRISIFSLTFLDTMFLKWLTMLYDWIAWEQRNFDLLICNQLMHLIISLRWRTILLLSFVVDQKEFCYTLVIHLINISHKTRNDVYWSTANMDLNKCIRFDKWRLMLSFQTVDTLNPVHTTH